MAETTDEIKRLLEIQYGRDDVTYDTWYGDWSKSLAKTMTLAEIERELGVMGRVCAEAAAAHDRAVRATHSMQSQSQRRAHASNVVAAAGVRRSALSGAREIHYLFPEHTRPSPDAESAA